jgi:hypothetical protein
MSTEAQHWFISPEDDQKITDVFKELRVRYKDYKDPWGFNLELCESALRKLMPLYRSYFKVRVFGIENVQDHPYLVVGNHTGQIPLDGMLVTMAFALDVAPPSNSQGDGGEISRPAAFSRGYHGPNRHHLGRSGEL